MHDMGLAVEKHHHRWRRAQAELGAELRPWCAPADNMQIYKYVVHNVASSTQDRDLHAEP